MNRGNFTIKKEQIVSCNPKVMNEVIETLWQEMLAASPVNNILTRDVYVIVDLRVV